MKVALHTVDLFPGRERLMPFRTVLEVAKVMRSHGWEADVVNSSVSKKDAKDFAYQGVPVIQCPRDFGEMSRWVNACGYDAFFFAATIREGLKDLSGLKEMTCRKIAYVPSGVSPKANALWMMRMYGMYAKAWVLEALTPKGLLGKKLAKAGFADIIGLTDYTRRKVEGVLKGHTIYPGKDGFEDVPADETFVVANGLKGNKFFLFTGGPAPSRGGAVLLRAFDAFADKQKDAKLVFLMRQDVGGEYDALFRVLDGLKHKESVVVLKDKLSVGQLKAYFEEAYVVVLPFICIPAEIPLTYYEVLSCGTPVVSFPNAGTTEYLREGLKICEGVSVSALTRALKELWNNESERNTLAIAGKKVMDAHPSWEQVGMAWMKVIKV